MNVSQLTQRVYYRIGRGQEASAGTYDTDILYALNEVNRLINNTINFKELRKDATLSKVSGTQAYDLATDFSKMVNIWNNASYDSELLKIDASNYKNFLDDVDTTAGQIHYYDIYDVSGTVEYLHLYPVPSTTENVPYQYQIKTTDLVSDANILTTKYPDLFIEGAAYILYRDLVYVDQPEKIAFRKGEFKDQIEAVRKLQRDMHGISMVHPKRLLPGNVNKLNVQTTGYSS